MNLVSLVNRFMSHQRIIGIIVLLCITLLFIPILKTSKTTQKSEADAPEILFSENANNADDNDKVTQVELSKKPAVVVTPSKTIDNTPIPVPEPPLLPEPNKTPEIKNEIPEPKKDEVNIKWVVQIAEIKANNIISLTDLKLALKKAKLITTTKTVVIKKEKWVQFYSQPQNSEPAAITLKNKIDTKLKKYRIKSTVKQQ